MRTPHTITHTSDFYTMETPPPSSTSKDSADDISPLFESKKRFKLAKTVGQQSNHAQHYLSLSSSSSIPTVVSNTMKNQTAEHGSSLYDEMQTPLRRALGNTKLKTRQDVRRFRKFLKRNYDLTSVALVDIDPDTLRTYLIHYLTSIRTRKGLKYDPETLRSYYLSVQRFLKDSNYPFCLRNSPQFAQCRDLIIRMRKEKSQVRTINETIPLTEIIPSTETIKKRGPKKNSSAASASSSFQHPSCSPHPCHYPIPVNCNTIPEQQQQVGHEQSCSDFMVAILTNTEISTCETNIIRPALLPASTSNGSVLSTKDLPSSSLPPRKRQQMKYFLESGSPRDLNIMSQIQTSPPPSPPISILSSDAYLLLVKFTRLPSPVVVVSTSSSSPSATSPSSSHRTHHLEQLLDESPACGSVQRSMLTTLCHEWAGDIRVIHANLRPELNSFLPHILVLSILSSKWSY